MKLSAVAALAVATLAFASCKDDNFEINDENAAAVAAQFVDHTVAPTYTALASKTELLADMLATLKQTPTNAGLQDARPASSGRRARLSSSAPPATLVWIPTSTAGPSTRRLSTP